MQKTGRVRYHGVFPSRSGTHDVPAMDISSQRASIWRRLAAMFYDGLVLVAVLIAASAILLLLNGGEPVASDNPWGHLWFFLVTYGFFAWFWTHGGQTLGMRAWKIRLVSADGGPLGWGQSLLRFLTALPAWLLLLIGITMLGSPAAPSLPGPLAFLSRLPPDLLTMIGAAWILWDNSRFSWRDAFCHSHVVNVSRSAPGSGSTDGDGD